jgi:hypothetical protein
MKTIKVNGTDISVSHEVKTDAKTQHTSVHVTVAAEDVQTVHVMTIGSVDKPLPASYDGAALQKDVDSFKAECAAMCESRLRAKRLAQSIQ